MSRDTEWRRLEKKNIKQVTKEMGRNKGRRDGGREEEEERGNETLMEADRRQSCWETQRQDANMMSSSFC